VFQLRRFFVATIIGCALFAVSAKADPLTFSNVVALQNNDTTRVDLFSNPGTTLLGPQVSFLVDITGILPAGVTNTLLITYVETGGVVITKSFEIPAFGTIPPPYSQLFTITSPGANYQGTMASLTIDILGSTPDFVIPGGPNAGQIVDSFTYHFNVAQPVPEPVSLVLLGTGMFGVWRKVSTRSRRRQRPSQ
jgi:PEP-CTERM motif